MRRRLIAVAGFHDAVAALGDSAEVTLVVEALIARAHSHPEAAPMVPGFSARVIKSQGYGNYPALRLVYRLEGDVVYLYDIASYDPLEE